MMSQQNIEEISIVLVGAGNLATNLGKALCRKGVRPIQVYSRTEESAQTLADVIGASYTTRTDQIRKDADLYIVALKDDALPALIPPLTEGRGDALWVHTAGSVPMQVWQGHAARYGVFYPMQTFSKRREVDFGNIPLFVESNSESDLALLKTLAAALTTQVHEADSEQRKSLHLAAVFTCNFTNHMYAVAEQLLQKYHLPFEAMLPLIDETARKVHELSPRLAQTGPAVRYDEQVMAGHLAMLADEPEWQQLYRQLSESIHHLTS